MVGEEITNVWMKSYPLLFDLGASKPTTRDVAAAVKQGGTASLTEAELRADAARYQAEEIHDTTQCPVCAKNDSCGTDCNQDEGGDPCVLCPGEDPNDLPDTCDGNECPNGGTVCTSDLECSDTQYCTNGCCSAIVL